MATHCAIFSAIFTKILEVKDADPISTSRSTKHQFPVKCLKRAWETRIHLVEHLPWFQERSLDEAAVSPGMNQVYHQWSWLVCSKVGRYHVFKRSAYQNGRAVVSSNISLFSCNFKNFSRRLFAGLLKTGAISDFNEFNFSFTQSTLHVLSNWRFVERLEFVPMVQSQHEIFLHWSGARKTELALRCA